MIFPENFELKIGFDRIRESVRNYCQSETAGHLLDAESFSSNYDEIFEKLLRVKECLIMISEEDFTIDPYPDVGEGLNKLMVKGTYLEVQEIADLRKNLIAVKGILNFSPCHIVVPKKIKVITIDIAMDLARLPYYMSAI